MRKRLVFIYHHGTGNEAIAKADFQQFFKTIELRTRAIPELLIDFAFCPTADALKLKISQLVRPDEENDEVYLHFCGHGNTKGIPYDDWLLKNNDLAIIIEHEKVKSCFFSSCRSADLVKIVNKRNIPVVIGTAGENDIQNNFAIAFQIEFYNLLLDHRTFQSAFEKAYTSVPTNLQNGAIKMGSLTRGEGALDDILATDINEMQIIFKNKKTQNSLSLLPANFIQEMNIRSDEKPFVLVWSDEILNTTSFEKAFVKNGFNDNWHLVIIKSDEIEYINKRGDDDPLLNEKIRLVLLVSRNELLPDPLRQHLNEDKIWRMDNYKVIVGIQNSISLDDVVQQQSLRTKMEGAAQIEFKNSPDELFKNDVFLTKLGNSEISFNQRKKVTLGINTKPLKTEMLEVEGTTKFVRIFLAKNINEYLVNFLVNWYRSFNEFKNSPYIIDNTISPDLDFEKELARAITTRLGTNQSLAADLYELIKEGSIIIFKNRFDANANWTSFINKMIETVKLVTSIHAAKPNEKPSLIFFLQDADLNLSLTNELIYLRKFSMPTPIDDVTIGEWKNDFKNSSGYPINLVKMIQSIVETLDVNSFAEDCPSALVKELCDRFKLPRKQILGI